MLGGIEFTCLGENDGVVILDIVERGIEAIHITIHQESIVDTAYLLDFLKDTRYAIGQTFVADDKEIVEARIEIEA